MYGHIYIRRKGCTIIRKADNHYDIYYALLNLGYDHEEAEDIASWAELAIIGDEYETGGQDEITLGE